MLFLIELRSRRVFVADITPNPTDWFTGQAALDSLSFLRGCRYLIHDRNTKYSVRFRMVMEQNGVDPIRTPCQGPNANAFGERFVLSIKSECLDRRVFFGEASLRRAVAEYVEHYHAERPHQGIGKNGSRWGRTAPAWGRSSAESGSAASWRATAA